MQAYQSAPCPYCGATWNPPGAQVCANCRNPLPPPQPGYAPPGYAPGSTTLRIFGQTFVVPVALPPIVVRYQQELAYAILGLVGLLVLLFGVTPALATSQVAGADQAVATAIIHQSKVDAGFASF